MSFYLYYIFHALLAVSILVAFFYLSKAIILNPRIHIKLISLLAFFALSNVSIGKSGLSLLKNDIGSYHYQPCHGNFGYNCNGIENEWRDKKALLEKFHSDNVTRHPENENDILYRTFDFKWWMFWEYYTYYTTDIYELPLLPKQCKKMN